MADKVQRFLVEISMVFEDGVEDDGPLTGQAIDAWIEEEAHMGNYTLLKTVIEDFKGPDEPLKPIWCLPRGCEDCEDRLNCISRPTT